MMFLEAKALMDKPTISYSGIEYAGTAVGDVLDQIQKYGGPGDAYRVEYRQLLASGDVKTCIGLANQSWINRIGLSPGVEITKIKPTDATSDRWAAIYRSPSW